MDDVLDLFKDGAFLVQTKALDIRMMWHAFYYWINLYYQASENYIEEGRVDDPTQWSALRSLYPQLRAIEARERRRAGSASSYDWRLTNDQIKKALEHEMQLSKSESARPIIPTARMADSRGSAQAAGFVIF